LSYKKKKKLILNIYNSKCRAYNTFNEEVTEEGYKKALSYPTLKKL